MDVKSKLTTKQQRFVDAYDGNATQAALAAGYSKKTAAFIGAQNLKKIQIIEAIKKRTKKSDTKRIATREDRQKFWTDTMQDSELDMSTRLRASELLGKSEADFTDKHQHSGPDGEKIELQVNFIKPGDGNAGNS